MARTLQGPLDFALAHAVTYGSHHLYSITPNIMYVRWRGASTLFCREDMLVLLRLSQ